MTKVPNKSKSTEKVFRPGIKKLNIKTDGPQVVVVSDKSIRAAEKWSKKDE